MKKITSILMLACAICFAASAQNPKNPQNPQKPCDKAEMGRKCEEKAQKMESMKIAFYTEAIGLTPDESKAFWPVYNEIESNQRNLIKNEHSAFKALNDAIKEKKSDTEINTLLDAYIRANEANINLHFKAANSYRSILGPAKVAKFFAAQERFRRQQFDNLRGGHGAPGRDGQGGFGPRQGAANHGDPAQSGWQRPDSQN